MHHENSPKKDIKKGAAITGCPYTPKNQMKTFLNVTAYMVFQADPVGKRYDNQTRVRSNCVAGLVDTNVWELFIFQHIFFYFFVRIRVSKNLKT